MLKSILTFNNSLNWFVDILNYLSLSVNLSLFLKYRLIRRIMRRHDLFLCQNMTFFCHRLVHHVGGLEDSLGRRLSPPVEHGHFLQGARLGTSASESQLLALQTLNRKRLSLSHIFSNYRLLLYHSLDLLSGDHLLSLNSRLLLYHASVKLWVYKLLASQVILFSKLLYMGSWQFLCYA